MDIKTTASRITVGSWIAEERREYADKKYGDDTPQRLQLIESMRNEGLAEGGEWDLFIGNQLKRVQLLGVDTPAGRQALGKLCVILLHAFETSVVVFGKPPTPARSSGDIVEWVQFNG